MEVNNGPFRIPIILIIAIGAILLAVVFFLIFRLSSSNEPTAVRVTAVSTALIDPATPTVIATVSIADYGSPPTVPAVGNPNEPTATAVIISSPESYSPLSPLPVEQRGLILNGDRTERVVALTFDVGETAENPASFDREIINVLNETNTPATFFLGGLWMEHNEAETRELAENPLFELGNHAWSHLDFAQISPEEMSSEILLTQQKMWEFFDWQTALFRLPYGTYTDEALEIIADHGMLTIQWDVVSGDPDPNILAEPMANWVLGQTQPGSIIIMHANGRGWHTAEALPTIISSLKEQGYTFVTISELLDLEEPQTPYPLLN